MVRDVCCVDACRSGLLASRTSRKAGYRPKARPNSSFRESREPDSSDRFDLVVGKFPVGRWVAPSFFGRSVSHRRLFSFPEPWYGQHLPNGTGRIDVPLPR